MHLVVTGGAGFIGSNFIRHWMKNHPEDTITNFDLLTYAGNLANLDEVANNPNYHFVQGDIRKASDVEPVVEKADIIVHFAAETHVDRSITDPASFLTTNVLGTHTLLEAAKKYNIKHFHHISTDEVFGSLELGSADKFNEDTPYNPHSPYSASKAASDHLVRAYYDTFGVPFTLTNCSNNYGPFHFPEKLIPLAITNILEGKKVPVYGDGLNVRDWLFVTDHCTAIEAVLLHGKVGETYSVGGMRGDVSNLEVIKLILKIMGKDESQIEFVKDRPGHDRRYAVDWSKMNKVFGWEPSVTLEEGLRQTIEWFVQNQEWWKNIKSGAYQDYYKKQYSQETT